MCNSLHWFQHDLRPLSDLVYAARVKHGKFNPPTSYPTDKELKLVETSSAESTVGSVLSHVTTSIQNLHPNVLESSFVRRSSRLEEKECKAQEQEEEVEEEIEDKEREEEEEEADEKEDDGVPRKKANSPSTPGAQRGSPKKQPPKKPPRTCKSYEVAKQKLLAALASDACKISEVAK